ncbi:MAG: hypothetical protein KF688_11905 [Pirellulales bacterium]|nr:hypothetical protein [Pirellulales bacterium]
MTRVGVLGTLVTIVLSAALPTAGQELTGRWGDVRLPRQLVVNSPTKKTKALAVVTLSTTCPLARRLVPRLNDLQREYASEGVDFVALFPNGADDLAEIARYAVEMDLALPVFKDDPHQPWHAELAMRTTPAVVLLDVREGFSLSRVVYRGQIDGKWAGGTQTGGQPYLAEALASFVAGTPPEVPETAASGCKIEPRAFYERTDLAKVEYYRDVLPLLQNSCQSCHRPGEAGAELFAAFDSYEAVAAASPTMLDRMQNRIMPPWHADVSPEAGVGGLKNDPRLTDRQINLFRAWVEDGCPAGDPADAPPAVDWPDPEAWKIGEPDLVFAMPEPYVVPRERLDEYQYYRVPADFPEDRYIQAIEVRPGNKAVVHHIGAIVGPATQEPLSSHEAMLKLYGLVGDRVRKIGDYIAGDPFNARVYPEQYALKLPAGHDIFFEMHYTPTGKSEEHDVSSMAIRWADVEPEHVLQTKVFNRKDVRIPPHEVHYQRTHYCQFSTDVLIYALGPHMHFRGKDFTLYKVEFPQTAQERRRLVLRVPTYHFGWQRTYEFETPLQLKAGEALLAVTHFDNSRFNPNNPDPEALVRYGLLSEQEMLNLRVKYERVDFGEDE